MGGWREARQAPSRGQKRSEKPRSTSRVGPGWRENLETKLNKLRGPELENFPAIHKGDLGQQLAREFVDRNELPRPRNVFGVKGVRKGDRRNLFETGGTLI